MSFETRFVALLSAVAAIQQLPYLAEKRKEELAGELADHLDYELRLAMAEQCLELEKIEHAAAALAKEQAHNEPPCDCDDTVEAIATARMLRTAANIGHGLSVLPVDKAVELVDDFCGAPVLSELRVLALRHVPSIRARLGIRDDDDPNVRAVRAMNAAADLAGRIDQALVEEVMGKAHPDDCSCEVCQPPADAGDEVTDFPRPEAA